MPWTLHIEYDNVQNQIALSMGNGGNPLLPHFCFSNRKERGVGIERCTLRRPVEEASRKVNWL
jgi:hypothetical protein